MNVQIDQLVKTLLAKEKLEDCSLQEVKDFADRHPYFGAAQLLLTKKMQIEKADEYNDQLQKTILFFHNPLWVKKILDETGHATVLEKKKEEPVPKDEIAEPTESAVTIPEIEQAPAAASEETKTAINKETSEADSLPSSKQADEATNPAEELVFEPYHTVDYFASQGIKNQEVEKPTDKFGQQLKSFTDWLKTMKKIPGGETDKARETEPDKNVEQMAEHSIENRDVNTIAMAEVWEKQGNYEKAIEIYHKLSLLEPDKSRYFAAKIEDLKKIK